MALPFRDRRDAGRQLASKLIHHADQADVIVLGLPRGGIPVAAEVAEALNAPLDAFLVRKLGVPGHEELAMGAIASGGIRVLNDDVVGPLAIPEAAIDAVEVMERNELARRERLYRGSQMPIDVRDRTVILVDDGLATGATMRAAAQALRQMQPARLIAAVPVGSTSVCESLRDTVDEVFCGEVPDPFYAVGVWYDDFGSTSDTEVQEALRRAAERQPAPRSNSDECAQRLPGAAKRCSKKRARAGSVISGHACAMPARSSIPCDSPVSNGLSASSVAPVPSRSRCR